MINGEIAVSLFCGGRGSATLIRELLRHPNITLYLLVNAYDDGLSTGKLREFIPGMLGPSDFRKNLSYLLDFFSTNQYTLEELLEYRLPLAFAQKDFEGLDRFVHNPTDAHVLHPELQPLFQALDDGLRESLLEYLRLFFAYHRRQEQSFDFRDCSMGNLLFAGAYLKHEQDFNRATAELATLLNGEVLWREEQIVGPQSPVRILDLFLLQDGLSADQKTELARRSLGEKYDVLRKLDARPLLAPQAREALLASDIIVFGPGTQFSSLLPSYMAVGVAEAIANSPAKVKAFVVNLARDHDIQGFDATDLVDQALYMLGDADNRGDLITHILYHQDGQHRDNGLRLKTEKLSSSGCYKNARVVSDHFANPVHPHVHNGHAAVHKLLQLYHEAVVGPGYGVLDIYIDLQKRSLARKLLWQEFLELDWKRHFSKVRLCVNGTSLPDSELPSFLQVVSVNHKALFSEVDVFLDWLKAGDSQFLVTLTGDGEYRLKDVLLTIDILKSSSFGAVHGSRNQSRRQLLNSMRSAYGESGLVYWLSWLGGFLTSALFALRYQVIFSDPLTGFRVYSRSRLGESVSETFAARHPATATGITKTLVKHAIEIAEVPVLYRTFQGFTDVAWRLRRGLKNAWGLLV
jgi:2-phospho-L-lactate transferase/gluconeogenesis factor (CofD/UPF0052 family)